MVSSHYVIGDYRFISLEKYVEMPGIEPGTSHMRSERSTTELHPPLCPQSLNHERIIIKPVKTLIQWVISKL